MREAALIAAVIGLAAAAHASLETASARASGDWRLSEVGGKIGCTLTLTLTKQGAFSGFEVKAPLACRRAFPPLKTVSAWALDGKGAIVLSDAKAQTIVTFPVQAKGPYEARAPDGRTWRLESLKNDRGSGDEAPFVTAPPSGW